MTSISRIITHTLTHTERKKKGNYKKKRREFSFYFLVVLFQNELRSTNEKEKKNNIFLKMPENSIDAVSKEWLQSELRSPTKSLIVLDCRSSNEFQEGHIRSAVNFSIPSLILKRLATGKIDLTSTIKCRDLKQRIQSAYNDSLFVLYNETTTSQSSSATESDKSSNNCTESNAINNSVEPNANNSIDANTINVLHRRLKQDGCHVYWLKGNIHITHIIYKYQYTYYRQKRKKRKKKL